MTNENQKNNEVIKNTQNDFLLEISKKLNKLKIIAIAGSYGKTTFKEILYLTKIDRDFFIFF